ncbi:MAG: DUF2062 domain-containing protein [Kiritimatiellaeota bacterium]|nr:DUF2062 domain-containing protein [Kiritimatiellota bacterium]
MVGTRYPMGARLRRRVFDPLAALFKQGLSPEKIVLCVVAGGALSVVPILGTTTILCTVAAVVLRLNLPAIQAVNWLCSGAQLLLIIPFIRIGEKLFGATSLPLSLSQLGTIFRADWVGFLHRFWVTLLHAIAGWGVVCLPLALLA